MLDGNSLRQAAHALALQIAIDGQAGAGKSTLGRNLAAALACPYLDTGLMYRALTLRALQQGVQVTDGAALARLAATLQFELTVRGLRINGQPAGDELRTPQVDGAVSQVSAHPEVRRHMVVQQRRLAEGHCVVMVGRDIGSVVLPHAPLKLWVTASPGTRALRRLREHLGGSASEAEVRAALEARDQFDSTRAASPLQEPAGAVVINTDDIEPHQALEKALHAVRDTVQRLEATGARG